MNNVCDICDKPFSTRNTMLRHRRTVHEPIVSKEKTKACNIMNWNYPEMINGLKSSYLLPSDYEYTGSEYPVENDVE